jgi:hypothetical protein
MPPDDVFGEDEFVRTVATCYDLAIGALNPPDAAGNYPHLPTWRQFELVKKYLTLERLLREARRQADWEAFWSLLTSVALLISSRDYLDQKQPETASAYLKMQFKAIGFSYETDIDAQRIFSNSIVEALTERDGMGILSLLKNHFRPPA